MKDDIVTRLRKYHHDEYLSYRHVLEAADEIERLRASVINTFDNGFDEIERLRKQLKQWQALCDTYYAKLVFEPNNTYHFITGYRYLAAGGK